MESIIHRAEISFRHKEPGDLLPKPFRLPKNQAACFLGNGQGAWICGSRPLCWAAAELDCLGLGLSSVNVGKMSSGVRGVGAVFVRREILACFLW